MCATHLKSAADIVIILKDKGKNVNLVMMVYLQILTMQSIEKKTNEQQETSKSISEDVRSECSH